MSAIDAISNATAAGATNAASGSGKSKTEDPQDRFLKLLVTQMKNQDPLNPLDNAQVTSQIAQISTARSRLSVESPESAIALMAATYDGDTR